MKTKLKNRNLVFLCDYGQDVNNQIAAKKPNLYQCQRFISHCERIVRFLEAGGEIDTEDYLDIVDARRLRLELTISSYLDEELVVRLWKKIQPHLR